MNVRSERLSKIVKSENHQWNTMIDDLSLTPDNNPILGSIFYEYVNVQFETCYYISLKLQTHTVPNVTITQSCSKTWSAEEYNDAFKLYLYSNML